ncbi:MAG: tetraacyldisaccharide 4'-kinase [Planctomycetota bacterium]
MKQRDFLALVSGKRTGLWAGVLRLFLRFASFFFWLGAWARLILFKAGWFKGNKVDVPVICVGNLTTGGTGKTPVVAYVVKYLQKLGRKPAIVSRGYKGDSQGNDELQVLEQLCPGVPHIQNPNRTAAAQKAIVDGADVVVMDDGFSHLKLARDLNILLFDSLNPFGYGRMLPRGLLREPLKSCSRAQFAIFTRADAASKERLRDLEDTIRCNAFEGDIAHAAHMPAELIGLNTTDDLNLHGSTVSAICGIGNPRGFEATLQQAGAEVSEILALDDHAAYNDNEMASQVVPFIETQAASGVRAVIATQKDAVKLRAKVKSLKLPMSVYELRVQLGILSGEDNLKAIIQQTVND